MYRSIMNDLLSWKTNPNRKPLLLTGIRQSGKTYILKQFGTNYFKHIVYLNFEADETLASLFLHDLNVERIIRDLSLRSGEFQIIPGETLLIFDEIQTVPAAITSLKYFAENLPDLHVVGAGSLLGLTLNREGYSFPVGKVDHLVLYPMSFLEFLEADGQAGLIEVLKTHMPNQPIAEAFSVPLKRALLNYYAVGGMPEAVKVWVTNHDFEQVRRIQSRILMAYVQDFSKHAPSQDVAKLLAIWESIPKQLAKDNQKFVFSQVSKGQRGRDLADALQWLKSAGLIHQLEKVENAELPLAAYADSSFFKIYLCDVGLLCLMADLDYETIVFEHDALGSFKGAITENFVMTELISAGEKPYYWRSGNTAELDFLLQIRKNIVPIEAKATLNTQAKSYREFYKRFKPEFGLRLSLKNFGLNWVEETKTLSIPLYATWNFRDYLNKSKELQAEE